MDDFEDVCDGVVVEVLMLICFDAFVMEFLVGDVAIWTKTVLHEVNDVEIRDSGVFINFGHEDGVVKVCLDLVDDGALNLIFLVKSSDHNFVLADTF